MHGTLVQVRECDANSLRQQLQREVSCENWATYESWRAALCRYFYSGKRLAGRTVQADQVMRTCSLFGELQHQYRSLTEPLNKIIGWKLKLTYLILSLVQLAFRLVHLFSPAVATYHSPYLSIHSKQGEWSSQTVTLQPNAKNQFSILSDTIRRHV